MKPIYIIMKAFGSYIDERIDFAENDSGLFLITGDTGAGKTTIFDAVTFALYGETSGGKREGRMMRSQYAQPDMQTEVTLKFWYDGEEYTIIRSPKQPKYKKDKETGEYRRLDTPISAKVELIMPDGSSYPGTIKVVNDKIEEIIGLSVEQFTQVAMLAQGEFMKLLLASSSERREIFAKIFDTHIYELIETELRERFSDAGAELTRNRNDISRTLENVKCIENSEYRETWNSEQYRDKDKEHLIFSESDSEGLLKLLENILKETNSRQKEVESAKKENEDRLGLITERLTQAETINRLFDNLHDRREEYTRLQSQSDEIAGLKKKIDRAGRANNVSIAFERYEEKKAEREKCANDICQLENWIGSHTDMLEQFKAQADKASKEYDEKSPSLLNEIHVLEESLGQYKKLEELEKKFNIDSERCIKLKAEIEKIKERQNLYLAEEEDLKNKLEEVREKSANIRPIELEVESQKADKETLDEVKEGIKELLQLEKDISRKELLYNKADKKAKEAKARYDSCYHDFIENQAMYIRDKLKPGDPCPVCGSIYHGFNHETESDSKKYVVSGMAAQEGDNNNSRENSSITEDSLNREKENSEKASEKREKIGEELTGQRSERQAKQDYLEKEFNKIFRETESNFAINEENYQSYINLIDRKLADVTGHLTELSQQYNNAKAAAEALGKYEERCDEIRRQKKNDDTCLAEKNDGYNELNTCIAKCETEINLIRKQLTFDTLETAQGRLKEQGEYLKKLETEKNSASEKYSLENDVMTGKRGELEQLNKHTNELTEKLQELEREYKSRLSENDFENTEDFQSARMNNEEIESMRNQVMEYEKKLEVTKNLIESLEAETKGKERVDTTEYVKDKEELSARKEGLEQEIQENYHILSDNRTAYERSRTLYATREKLNSSYMILKNLCDTANGKLERKHLNFQTYIQRRFFKEIVNSANKRLNVMANGQFLLQCRDLKELAGQGQVGLELDVYSIVNDQTRDVKTLSGGESFMAALSMALGMADIIQNNSGSIHIDTMFIDEGFGSLSEDTRNQAISILNELSGGKRLVGIISHVSELKSQVDRKLVVTKNDKGSHARWEFGTN